jgi:hypothetical protein
MLLSICIPSIPSRFNRIEALYKELEGQIGDRKDIEIISIIDNHQTVVSSSAMEIITDPLLDRVRIDHNIRSHKFFQYMQLWNNGTKPVNNNSYYERRFVLNKNVKMDE